MKSFTITESAQYSNKISGNIVVSDYIRLPLRYGITGFVLLLVVSTLMKLIGYLAGTISTFKFDGNEILLSIIGFIFLFLIRFLANFKVGLGEKVTERKSYPSEAA